MSRSASPQSQDEILRKTRRKRWTIVVIILLLLILLCVVSFCTLGVIGFTEGMKPKTNSVLYQDASISHMVATCDEERFYSYEDWMVPIPGTNTVTALKYSKSGPAPEAFYAYSLFIQIDPELLITGKELSFPEEGILAFLLETRAPFLVCTSDLWGSITILTITGTTLTAQLDVSGLIDGIDWKFNGEVEFKQAPLPVSGVEQKNGLRLMPHTHPYKFREKIPAILVISTLVTG